MTRMLVMLALAMGLAGLSLAGEITPREARESADGAIATLLKINNALVDHYFHTGKWEEAVAVVDRIIVLNPGDINPYANAAWLLWSTGQLERAMGYYKKMIDNNPDNPEAYYTVGHYFFFNRRDYAAALPYLAKVVELGGTAMQQHLYAHCLTKLERTAEALAAWRAILAAFPESEVAKREIEKIEQAGAANAAKDE